MLKLCDHSTQYTTTTVFSLSFSLAFFLFARSLSLFVFRSRWSPNWYSKIYWLQLTLLGRWEGGRVESPPLYPLLRKSTTLTFFTFRTFGYGCHYEICFQKNLVYILSQHFVSPSTNIISFSFIKEVFLPNLPEKN